MPEVIETSYRVAGEKPGKPEPQPFFAKGGLAKLGYLALAVVVYRVLSDILSPVMHTIFRYLLS
jgi:hypothetical protein